jgi:hypothetical protein
MGIAIAFLPSALIGVIIVDRYLVIRRLRAVERAGFVRGFRYGVAACNRANMREASATDEQARYEAMRAKWLAEVKSGRYSDGCR